MIARYYYDERFRIKYDADLLRALRSAVAYPNDLTSTQWAQWYSAALGFQPDLILELGRGHGNSTALFAQAAARLGDTQIVSLCHSPDWSASVVPRLKAIVDPQWLGRVDARVTDIRAVNYDELLEGRKRVLVLWDAHGFDVAEVVLGVILPAIADRPHLILMHDLLDNRYADVSRSYEGHPLWKGSEWQRRTGFAGSRVNIGWMHAIQDQVIALADFSSRNGLEIGSGDHEYHQFFDAHPERAVEMRELLGDEYFSRSADWAFLSLNGRDTPASFPAVDGRDAIRHECGAIEPALIAAPIVTMAKPWEYALMARWQASRDIPPGTRVWLSVTLRVEGGSIGLGILGANGSDFAERRAVGIARQPVNVRLPVADPSRAGTLVVQTWDAPVSARVCIEDLSLVW